MDRKISPADMGYDGFFESAMAQRGWVAFSPARVIAEYKEAYRVKNTDGECLAKITGKQMYEARKREDYPAVGDWVAITKLPGGNAVVHGVLPRRTVLAKQYSGKQSVQIIAANIDTAFIVESMDRDYNLHRFERYLVLAQEGGIAPVIVLNKTDLISPAELEARMIQLKNRFNGIEIACSSTVKAHGLTEISNRIAKGKTYCFLGSSGVGKSSLINRLLGKDEIITGEVNSVVERGRHTTTVREMYFLENGGIVIDNPGTRGVGIAASGTGLENVFDEISRLSIRCRFANCSHLHEPGCAVLDALEQRNLDKDRYDNYIKLKKETDFYRMNEVERREKDRRFGKSLKKYHDMVREE